MEATKQLKIELIVVAILAIGLIIVFCGSTCNFSKDTSKNVKIEQEEVL